MVSSNSVKEALKKGWITEKDAVIWFIVNNVLTDDQLDIKILGSDTSIRKWCEGNRITGI